jgi:methylmalonyl-CoA mutase C-terminal domain/subunit
MLADAATQLDAARAADAASCVFTKRVDSGIRRKRSDGQALRLGRWRAGVCDMALTRFTVATATRGNIPSRDTFAMPESSESMRAPARSSGWSSLAQSLRSLPTMPADHAASSAAVHLNHAKLRILVAKPGLDGHDRGAKVVALERCRMRATRSFTPACTRLLQWLQRRRVQEAVDAVGLSVMSGRAHDAVSGGTRRAASSVGPVTCCCLAAASFPKKTMSSSCCESGVAALFKPGATTREIIDWVEKCRASSCRR